MSTKQSSPALRHRDILAREHHVTLEPLQVGAVPSILGPSAGEPRS
jgi:hypothetical protein